MSGFTLWRRDLPPGPHRDQVTLEPRATRDCAGPDWRDCVLVVEDGDLVLTTAGGETPLQQGAVFCLAGFTAPALHNPGPRRATVTRARRVPTATTTHPTGKDMS